MVWDRDRVCHWEGKAMTTLQGWGLDLFMETPPSRRRVLDSSLLFQAILEMCSSRGRNRTYSIQQLVS